MVRSLFYHLVLGVKGDLAICECGGGPEELKHAPRTEPLAQDGGSEHTRRSNADRDEAKDNQPDPRRRDNRHPVDELDFVGYHGMENLHLDHPDKAHDEFRMSL